MIGKSDEHQWNTFVVIESLELGGCGSLETTVDWPNILRKLLGTHSLLGCTVNFSLASKDSSLSSAD